MTAKRHVDIGYHGGIQTTTFHANRQILLFIYLLFIYQYVYPGLQKNTVFFQHRPTENS